MGKLFSAVAANRPENIACQALRVSADQNRLSVVDRSKGERHVLLALGGAVDEHLEGAVTGREVRPGNLSGDRRDHDLTPCTSRTALSAAQKPTFLWVPSQNGSFVDSPQRHSATVARSVRNSLPSASSSTTEPVPKYGPLSRAVVFVCSAMNVLLLMFTSIGRTHNQGTLSPFAGAPRSSLSRAPARRARRAFGFAPSATPIPILKTSSPPR